MNIKNRGLISIVEQVGRKKNINRNILIRALEEALLSAFKKKHGTNIDLEAKFNEELNEVEVYEFKQIVNKVNNPLKEISLINAKKMNSNLTSNDIGEDLGIKMDNRNLSRIAAQNAKQIIIQRIKDAERLTIFNKYKNRKDELVTGIAKRFDKAGIIIDLGHAEGIIPTREQLEKENIRIGDKIIAYVINVLENTKKSQIILSRIKPNFIVKLFEQEVPEISEGIVVVESISREAGSRTKIAVRSKDTDVDPVGACVGIRGARVQTIVQELKGEKIDIVPFDEDVAKFACNALAPAEINRVLVNENNHKMNIVVPDNQLSLAIGRKGQNVRLAAELIGWKIEIDSESKVLEKKENAWLNLSKITTLNEVQFHTLYNYGFKSINDIIHAEDNFFDHTVGFKKGQFNIIKQIAKTIKDETKQLKKKAKQNATNEAKLLLMLDKIYTNNKDRKHENNITLKNLTHISKSEIEILHKNNYQDIIDIYLENDLQQLFFKTKLNKKKLEAIYNESKKILSTIIGKNLL